MEGMHAVTVMVVMMTLVLTMTGAKANVEEEGCLERCLEGCKHSGISPLRCFKYCEKHCGSPSPSSAAAAPAHKQKQQQPPSPPPGHHYCNLGCILEKCSKFHDDEAPKEEACALDCKNHVCKPANF